MDHLNQVQSNLITVLKEGLPQFNKQIYLTTDVDYSADGVKLATNSAVPILYLVGPDTSRNPLFTTNQKPAKRYGAPLPNGGPPSQFTTFTAEDAVDLLYRLVLLDTHTSRFTDLTTAVYAYFMNGKTVSAERNPGTPADGVNTYEIDLIEKFASGRIVNRSNLKETSGRLIIRGVQVSDGGIFEQGYVADDTNVDTQPI